jgi:hypothetical protein
MTAHNSASAVEGGIPPQLNFGLPCPAATDSHRCVNASSAIGLLAAAFLILGCKAPQADMRMHIPLGEDFSAHIWRSSAPDTNTVMRVFIGGEVHHPGPLELPSGRRFLMSSSRMAGSLRSLRQSS